MSLVRFNSTSEMPDIQQLNDTVSVKNLNVSCQVDNELKKLKLNLDLKTSFSKASVTDDLKYSINYAVLSRGVKSFEADNKNKNFPSLKRLADELFKDAIFKEATDHASLSINEIFPNYLLQARFNRSIERQSDKITSQVQNPDIIRIGNLRLMTIIGVFTEERFMKQPVVLDITIETENDSSLWSLDLNAGLTKKISDYIENSNFKTVEALVLNVCKLVYKNSSGISRCEVKVLKPDAIDYTDGVGVSIIRTRKEIDEEIGDIVEFDNDDITVDKFVIPNLNSETTGVSKEKLHIVYLAFGSNVGNQLSNITGAINSLNEKGIKVLQTSSLYKSKPMYYLDQSDFINGALKVETSLSPKDLLKELKDIEYNVLKRVKKFDNGPRSIDLDILFYDNLILNDPILNIPHIRMLERSFVMLPLCELLPPSFIHPVTAEPVHESLKQLITGTRQVDSEVQQSIDLINLVPLINNSEEFKYIEYDLFHNKSKTQLMSILNITPDSFSDGSESNLDLEIVLKRVDDMIANGVDIIDIGGCSTRPNSKQPSEEEELNRVLPVIKAIRDKYPFSQDILLSVDTYRARVAEESIKVGADIVNDVSAGLFDEKIYEVVAKYGVPYIINHLRGDISTMNKLTGYTEAHNVDIKIFNKSDNEAKQLINVISEELATCFTKMTDKGIRRWQIILDPGLGFAKNMKQNLNVIRELPFFKKYQQYNAVTGEYISFENIPLLLGPSRKRFIGAITGKDLAKERVNGTSAAVTACVGYGSDIVRVHDYKEMKDACLMADAIYKGIY